MGFVLQNGMIHQLQRFAARHFRLDDFGQMTWVKPQLRVPLNPGQRYGVLVVQLISFIHFIHGVEGEGQAVAAFRHNDGQIFNGNVGSGAQTGIHGPLADDGVAQYQIQQEAAFDGCQAIIQKGKTDKGRIVGSKEPLVTIATDHVCHQAGVPSRGGERGQVGGHRAAAGVDVVAFGGKITTVDPGGVHAAGGGDTETGMKHGFNPGLVTDQDHFTEKIGVAVSAAQTAGQPEFIIACGGVQPQNTDYAVAGEDGWAHTFVFVCNEAEGAVEGFARIPTVDIDDVAVRDHAVGEVFLEDDIDVFILTGDLGEAGVVAGVAGEVAQVAEAAVVQIGSHQYFGFAGVIIDLGVEEVDQAAIHSHIGPQILVTVRIKVIVGDGLSGIGGIHENEGPLVLIQIPVHSEPACSNENGGKIAGSRYGDAWRGIGFFGAQTKDPFPGADITGGAGAGAQNPAILTNPDYMHVAGGIHSDFRVVFILTEGGHFIDRPGLALIGGFGDVDVAIGAPEVFGGKNGV